MQATPTPAAIASPPTGSPSIGSPAPALVSPAVSLSGAPAGPGVGFQARLANALAGSAGTGAASHRSADPLAAPPSPPGTQEAGDRGESLTSPPPPVPPTLPDAVPTTLPIALPGAELLPGQAAAIPTTGTPETAATEHLPAAGEVQGDPKPGASGVRPRSQAGQERRAAPATGAAAVAISLLPGLPAATPPASPATGAHAGDAGPGHASAGCHAAGSLATVDDGTTTALPGAASRAAPEEGDHATPVSAPTAAAESFAALLRPAVPATDAPAAGALATGALEAGTLREAPPLVAGGGHASLEAATGAGAPARPAASGAAGSSAASSSGAAAPVAEQLREPLIALSGATGGGRAVTVRLDPASLGSVHIRIERSSDSSTRIEVTAERPDTLALLTGSQADLQRALDHAGVPAEKRILSFHAGSPDAPAPENGPSGGFPGQNGSGERGSQPDARRSGPDGERYRGSGFGGSDAILADGPPSALARWRPAGLDITA